MLVLQSFRVPSSASVHRSAQYFILSPMVRKQNQQQAVIYRCPTHPQVTSSNPNTKCYICVAEYKAATEAAKRAEAARRAAEAQRALALAAQQAAAAARTLAARQAVAAAKQAAAAQQAQQAAYHQVAAANKQINAAWQARGVAAVARKHAAHGKKS
ncbi:hypothetical protein K466DRAFT_660000 [Polyporus arcularius HHB13444]|uniref:Uncharacterized protein n=1 Tax=Polyporus arcularius HHB13444 TaxID=1314778 RepID=A0A5C3PQW0_9APHY|nr:hypothetical protein K466DRAFT_660000 [Polyporus arcularius HHB13444]